MPGDFYCKKVRLVDGIFRPGHLLPPRQGGVRLRGTERILHCGEACRRDIRLLRGGGGEIRRGPGEVRYRGVRLCCRRASRAGEFHAGYRPRLRKLGPGLATSKRLPVQEGRESYER